MAIMANVQASQARPALDRRKQSRSSMNGCKAYIVANAWSKWTGSATTGCFPVVNLSRSGMLMLGKEPLKVGTVMKLSTQTEGFIEPMLFKAKVIWTAKVVGRKVHRIGVEFLKVDKDSIEKLSSLTNDLYFRKKQMNKTYK